ncbi:hypothetical protein [Pseudomonas sp. NA-150]|uniref:hypothetical protein n=1 Tax=Pseudomonas sp. NA-150 TaxID=3367525 RepID=UPI0037C553D1
MARTTPHIALVSLLSAALMTVALSSPVQAGPRERGAARTSVNRPSAPNAQPARHPNVSNNSQNATQVNAGNNNRVGNTTNINNSHNTVNNNVNVNRDVNVNVDGRGRYGYDEDYHPIATAAAVTATVAVTAAVVGAIVRPAQMPTSCVQVIQSGVTYMQCGSTWYQPQYVGSDVTYVVINAPY